MGIRTPFDYLAQGLLERVLPWMGQVTLEQKVQAEAQRADVAFEPDPGRIGAGQRLGLLGQMAGAGPCMFEPFSRTPPLDEVRACVRKQYTFDHMRVLAAAQGQEARPPFPRLWVLSAGEPRSVLAQYALQPMTGWPEGFWEGPPAAPLHVVVLRSLPRVRATLLLRLMGRGVTLSDAVDDLRALPADAWELQVSLPLLVAFRVQIPHDSLEAEEVNAVRNLEVVYAEWEKRVKEEAQQEVARQYAEREKQVKEKARKEARLEMLREQLEERFGPLPADAVARVEGASSEELGRWIHRVLHAQTLADVLAG